MTERTTLLDHSDLAGHLLNIVESFIDEVAARGCTAHLESVTTNGKFLRGEKLGQQPERFIEDHLIFPVLRSLGHSILPRPVQYAPRWRQGRGIPDFCLTSVPVSVAKENHVRLFGEAKAPNKIEYARQDVHEYLQKDLDFRAVAILTDGVEWELWVRSRNESISDLEEYEPEASASLRGVIGDAKSRHLEDESYHAYNVRSRIETDNFTNFTRSGVLSTVKSHIDEQVD